MTRLGPQGGGARRRVLTIRARLSLSYAALVAGCGAVLITLVYLYMRYVPTYDLQIRMPTVELDPSPDRGPATELDPTIDIDQVELASPLEIRSVDDILDNLLTASLIALGILIIIGGIIGWIMAGRIIKPLSVINTAANRAANGTLHHRIDMGGPQDEIRELSMTFDRMLHSLEQSFEAQQRFAANASHELRTPLTTVKTMIDVTLADPDIDPVELRALAERIRDVNQSNIDTVEALLDLASASSIPIAREHVDIATVTEDVIGELTAEFTKTNLTVTSRTRPAWTVGNPVLIRHAISNLLRNASRHNHTGGRITVHVTTTATAAQVVVKNTGAVISPDSVDRLAEPFARAHGRTVTRGSGHGLGLAIVAAIARAHDSALSLTANPDGGLTAQLDFPVDPPQIS